jgi:ubiquitin carboxyl-terminal hydrolase 10
MGLMTSKKEVSVTLNECWKHSVIDTISALLTSCFIQQKAQSVKDALENFVGRDQLEGLTCSRTNQEIEAWQQVTLEELPSVLLLHLKWFDYKLDGASKIVKCVEFPIDLKVDPSKYSSLADMRIIFLYIV